MSSMSSLLFDFFMPTQLLTGENAISKHSAQLSKLGKHCLIVTSGTAAKKSGALADMQAALDKEQITYSLHDSIQQNPLLLDAYQAGETARKENADFIVGIGGGSPQDAAKVIAIFAANELKPEQVFEQNWENPALPVVVVGTTAGTGSEVTPFAVMTQENGVKRSVGHPQCFPRIAFGDAKYTATLSLPFTLSTALDALSHAVEGYFCSDATEISDLFAKEAIKVLTTVLSQLDKDSTDPSSVTLSQREQLYYGSILAGFTLSYCGTTYCHSLGYFLSEDHQVPHGAACAVFLPGFISRQVGYLPKKAEILFEYIGLDKNELVSLITLLRPEISATLTGEEIEDLVDRYTTSGNFRRTAPAGLSREEAVQIMTDLFSK